MAIAGDARTGTRRAYEVLARRYDLLTGSYDHETWLCALEALALAHGLRGRRVLDVACGTGKSFLPLLGRGYAVTATDLSPAMLAQARAKAPGVELVEADMCELPALGEFDLVTCLDDALNYLDDIDDVRSALAGMRRHLAPAGLAIWDVNTEAMYRGAFSTTWAVEDEEALVLWRGDTSGNVVIDVFESAPDGGWLRTTSSHRQRHWPAALIASTAEAAGLHVMAVRGQHEGARLTDELDETCHPKAVFLACRDDREHEGGVGMNIGRP